MDFTNTRTLLGVVEQNYPPSTTLVDTFSILIYFNIATLLFNL